MRGKSIVFLTVSAAVMTACFSRTATAGTVIPSLQDYLLPNGLKPFRVEDGNYYEKAAMIDYEMFWPEDIMPYLWDEDLPWTEEDQNNDGKVDYLECTDGNAKAWIIVDSDYDGYINYAYSQEETPGIPYHFTAEWQDMDGSGTIDVVTLGGPVFIDHQLYGVEYVFGDMEAIDENHSTFDYTTEGRIRYIQVTMTMPDHPLGEIQLFRDDDGDGYFDMMQIQRFYDTDNDGTRESMTTFSDRNMDGKFEEQYSYDGTAFNRPLW